MVAEALVEGSGLAQVGAGAARVALAREVLAEHAVGVGLLERGVGALGQIQGSVEPVGGFAVAVLGAQHVGGLGFDACGALGVAHVCKECFGLGEVFVRGQEGAVGAVGCGQCLEGVDLAAVVVEGFEQLERAAQGRDSVLLIPGAMLEYSCIDGE